MSLQELLTASEGFMPHGHCYLWIPSILWMHVVSDFLIGTAYVGISLVLYLLVRRIRLPFSPVFVAFGLFIGLCGMTHFFGVWTVWYPDYVIDGLVKVATAVASVATAIGLLYVRPQVEEVAHAARLSEERRVRLETTNAELQALYEKVKQLDAAKTEFFANVSHELRTPLSLILGPVERLLEDDSLSVHQRRQVDSIRRNGRALLKQVNDLLDVAKLEAGKMHLRYERIDLAELLLRIAAQFELAAQEHELAFRLSVPAEAMVECDPEKVERVVANLLSNAFKFTPRGGQVIMRLTCDTHDAVLVVSDNGPGIAEDQQAVVFKRFGQAFGGTTGHHGGTGLGLSIVKEFTELHGGQVSLVSSPGQGASFTVRLPRHAPAGAVIVEPAHASSRTSDITVPVPGEVASASGSDLDSGNTMAPVDGTTVLVVEDNDELRQFVAEVIGRTHRVATAADGKEGLAKAMALRPDLIVTDIMMPNMSGEQLVRALRMDAMFNTVPVLLLSARADDELRIDLLRNGAQDYLVKPFLPQELVARVNNLLTMKHTADVLRAELTATSGNVQELAAELAARHRQLRIAFDAAEVARKQAEQASRVKSQFLGLISHELRTPLSTILMNAQMLSAPPAVALPPEKIAERASRVLRASGQMGALVEGMLEYARVESGRIEVCEDEVDLNGVVDEVVSAHRDLASAAVVLQRDDSWSGDATIRTDARLVGVVLSNLVSNALKFTECGTVSVGLHRDDAYMRITVTDTGIGIAPEDLARIFEPFEQLEPLRRKSVPGVGLGLALAREIAEALRGRIEVTSTPGQGSTFAVALPLTTDIDRGIGKG